MSSRTKIGRDTAISPNMGLGRIAPSVSRSNPTPDQLNQPAINRLLDLGQVHGLRSPTGQWFI